MFIKFKYISDSYNIEHYNCSFYEFGVIVLLFGPEKSLILTNLVSLVGIFCHRTLASLNVLKKRNSCIFGVKMC